MIHDQKVAFETARYLLQINAIKLNPKNPFQWASGWKSPIYCDNRIALSFPEVRNHLCDQLVDQARVIYGEKFVVAGVATGAIGIGVLVANAMGLPFLYVRPQPKSHGRKNQIEGHLDIGAKVLVIEDLISTGKSSLGAVRVLQDAGAEVLGMLALFTYNFEISNQNFSKNMNDGLKLKSSYITNILKCVPPGDKPMKNELLSCSNYFEKELDYLKNLKVIVALGKVAFDNCLKIYKKRFNSH